MAEYKTLAKKADRNLRNLEKASEREGYQAATKWAYARAIKDIEHMFGAGQTRFDKKIPKTKTANQIQAAINDVKSFLSMESSTVGGINKIYRDRVKTFNERYGTKFTLNSYISFVELGGLKVIESRYASKQTVKQFAKIMKSKNKIVNEMKKASNTIGYEPSENAVMAEMIKRLENLELSVEDLIE